MKRIIAAGVVIGQDGKPISGRTLVLQGFTGETWTDLAGIPDGEFQVEVQATTPAPGEPAGVLPLRLVDRTGPTPTVISDGPMLTTQQDSLLADFGRIRLLKEPYRRAGRSVEGELAGGVAEPVKDLGSQEYEAEIRQLRGELTKARESLAAARRQLDTHAEQLSGQKARLSDTASELDQSKVRLASATTELNSVRAELSAARSEVQRLAATIGTPTKVADVFAALGSQLSAANVELAVQPTPFRLTDVRVDLRGRVGDGGETIAMDGRGDGSGLHATIAVEGPSPGPATRAVPDIVGLTESAAGRVLRSVGLRVDAATQRLPKGEGVPGQAVAQHPAAGEQAEFGSPVLVIFGVRSDEK